MPAQSLNSERYVVYSVESPDDLKSNSSDSRESVTFTSPEFVDLALRKIPNGHRHEALAPSPVPSTPTTDKWGSYWSNRERCCCFWNFVMFVSLVVLSTIIILVTKGMVDLHQPDNDSTISNEKFSSADVTLTTVPCASPKPSQQTCKDDTCFRVTAKILTLTNFSVNPCDDFYTYACGDFTRTTTVTWDKPRIRVNPDILLQQHKAQILDTLAEDVSTQDSEDVTSIKKIFQSCIRHTDTPLTQVIALLNELGGFEWNSTGPTNRTKPMTLTRLVAETAVRFGTFVLFDVDVHWDGSMAIFNRFSDNFIQRQRKNWVPIKRYRFLKPSDYIYRDENTDEILQAYKTYIGDFLGFILGINATLKTDQRYLAMIDDIYHLDVYINRVLYSEDYGNLSDGDFRCQSQLNLDDLQYQFSYNISWRRLFSIVFNENGQPLKSFNICFVALNNALTEVISEFSFISVKQYILFNILVNSDLYSLLPIDTPTFKMPQWQGSAFNSKFGHSAIRTDVQCLDLLSTFIPLSNVIHPGISPKLSGNLRTLFKELVSSLGGIISDMYWVPSKQKRHLLTALSDLKIKFDWRRQNNVMQDVLRNVSSDFFSNFNQIFRYSSRMQFSGFTQRRHEGSSSIFNLESRIVGVPNTAHQIPLVDTPSFSSTWYGTAGTILSQTISKLFDIDALLKLLTEDKIDHRVALTIAFRLQCLVDEYNNYVIHTEEGRQYKIKSDFTKSANFGDSLALRVAYNAYSKHRQTMPPGIAGLPLANDQLFFISYAQTMCEKANERGLFQHYINNMEPHEAPGKFRVLGTLSNFKKFAETFNCDQNTNMNPLNKCTLF